MKPIIVDMKDLSESAQIYESAPNKVAVAFVYIMAIFTVAAVLWMSLFSIDEVINADAILIRDEDQTYHMEMYISSRDYGQVSVGQSVKFEILAYPATDYQYYYGQIQEISHDPIYSAETGGTYYQVTVTFNESDLKDLNGNPLSLAEGLDCRANIVTGHEKIIEYVFKKV